MPANKKYLSTVTQRILKISGGLIGGYFVMISFHLLLSIFMENKNAVATSFIFGYLIWAGLIIMAFLAKNGWKVWGIYLLITILFLIPFLLTRY